MIKCESGPGGLTTNNVARNLYRTEVPARGGHTQLEIDILKTLVSVADRLSGLNLRLGYRANARLGRHRCDRGLEVAAEVLLLEDRCLMAKSALGLHAQEGPDMPADHINPDLKKLFVGTAEYKAPPTKLITIFNNSTTNWEYPILEDANASLSNTAGVSLYDPLDAQNNEYRGYIGYAVGKKDYLGLAPGASITIAVPLVFWNGGTVQIATTNPLQDNATWTYRTDATRYTLLSSTETPNGRVMWYHSKTSSDAAENTNPGAATQLAEWTFRDSYLGTLPTGSQITPSEKPTIPFVNYDVSYVDNMMLPVAMEAPSTSPPNFPAVSLANGWLGSNLQVGTMQGLVDQFTSTSTVPGQHNALLGTYFGGKGYDQYFIPDAATIGARSPRDTTRLPIARSPRVNRATTRIQSVSSSPVAARLPGWPLRPQAKL